MNEGKPLTPYAAWRWLCRNACLCSIALALATAGCISVGVFLEERKQHPDASPVDTCSIVIYETAQVMLLGMPTHAESNYGIFIGRFLAVLLVLFLGIQAVAKLLGDSWQNLLLLGYQRHHLVCGLGRIGWQLVQELLNQGEQVVVIERDPANPLCTDARRLGAIVIIGDATDDEMLEHAQLRKAAVVYIVTGSDEANIEAAVGVQETAQQSETPETLPQCFVHVLEPALRNSLRIDGKKALPMSAFNIVHNTVRNLIVRQLTPVRPREPDEVALYVIVGFGLMGQTLAAQLAELAHFENCKRARLLILADKPTEAADKFLSRWGQFSPRVVAESWAQIAFDPACDAWSCRAHRPGPAYQVADDNAIEYVCNAVFAPCPSYIAERGFLDALTPLLRQPGVKPALIVCMDREHESFGSAIALEQGLRQFHGVGDVPVFVWLPKQEPLRKLLTGTIAAFGLCREELRLENVLDPLEEKLAIAIMADYEKLDPEKDRVKVLEKWRADAEFFRQSNRSAATHALIALGCLGMRLVQAGEADDRQLVRLSASGAEKAILAEVEHNRWIAERLLAGFTYGEQTKTDQPPRRLQLCTWQILKTMQAKEPAKDFRQIEVVFATLQRLGYALVKAEEERPSS